MTVEETDVGRLTPWGNAAKTLLHSYGLGLLFCANVFGAGSVYILADTGANYAFALLWVLPLTFIVDIAMHDMSARLAVHDEPLAYYIKDRRFGKTLLIGMALMSALWSVANYTVAGAALAWFIPGVGVIAGTILVAGMGIALVQLKVYDRIEAAITAMVFAVFGSYGLILFGLDIPVRDVVTGLQPMLQSDIGYMTAVIALLGTTVYWPNFFIQSSINPTKEWDELNRYRRDNAVGIVTTLIIGSFVMIVAAITLSEGEMTLIGPGLPLESLLGTYALVIFVAAVFMASLTSATGTLFGAGFIVPQSFNLVTEFGDWAFRGTVIVLIVLSVVGSALMLTYTEFTPVRMAIIMPAINGAIGLPITAFAMIGAVNKYGDVDWKTNIMFVIAATVLLLGSILTAQSLYNTVMSFI